METLCKDTRRAEVGEDVQEACRQKPMKPAKERDGKTSCCLDVHILTKKNAKTFSLPEILQKIRNCHHSSETVSQLNGQIANIPILDLAQFQLPSLTKVVDTLQNSLPTVIKCSMGSSH